MSADVREAGEAGEADEAGRRARRVGSARGVCPSVRPNTQKDVKGVRSVGVRSVNVFATDVLILPPLTGANLCCMHSIVEDRTHAAGRFFDSARGA